MKEPVETIFDEYVAAFDVGDLDPKPFLARVEGTDRRVLEELIDGFLESDLRSPEWDPVAFQASPAAAVSDAIAVSLEGRSGQWPEFLPHLRQEKEILREDVVAGLARELEATDEAEKQKVKDYYHDMEQGTLPESGVSDRVIGALAAIYETSAEKIRQAGRALGPRRGFEGGPVFARRLSDSDFETTLEGSAETPARRAEAPDRIDRLFTEAD
ncbi:MAG: hypothetical protein JJE10_03835 [Thermoleophilia bacterium]|nr:hypothetical protein [Thermoleophilia bacterium]